MYPEIGDCPSFPQTGLTAQMAPVSMMYGSTMALLPCGEREFMTERIVHPRLSWRQAPVRPVSGDGAFGYFYFYPVKGG